jgi:hypothetical protein
MAVAYRFVYVSASSRLTTTPRRDGGTYRGGVVDDADQPFLDALAAVSADEWAALWRALEPS